MLTTLVSTALATQVLKKPEFDQATVMPKTGEEVAVMATTKGDMVIMFFPTMAPKHVENFKKLAKKGFYEGVRFHRCIPGFMVQGGDPNTKNLDKPDTWGYGGNEENGKRVNVDAEFTGLKHLRGILSMARSQDIDSASSQFFLMHADAPTLDGNYSAFGKIVKGIEVVDAIVGTGQRSDNGKVTPDRAAQIVSVKLKTWPLEGN